MFTSESHSYNGYTSNPDGTCVDNGTQTGACVCGKTDTIVEPNSTVATNHVGDTEIRNAVIATCSQQAYSGTTYCLSCNEVISYGTYGAYDNNAHNYVYESISETQHQGVCSYNSTHKTDAEAHNFETVSNTPVTCTTNGVLVERCTVCGYERTTTTNYQGHNWSSWTEDPNGTTHTRTCSNSYCTVHTETADHNWSAGTPAPATCINYSSTPYTCSDCGATKTEYGTQYSGHSLEFVPASSATCVDAGNTAYYRCTVCDKYFTDDTAATEISDKTSVVIPADTANGHSYGDFASNGNGTHTKTCTLCDANVANHTVTDNCSGGTATCAAKAYCTVCSTEYGELDPSNHENLQPVAVNSATCTAPGNNAYYYCDACDKSFTDAAGTLAAAEADIEIPATGHDWSVTFTWDDTVTPPTATVAFVCTNNAEHNTTVDASVTEIASTAAHCGEQGSVTYRASYTMDGETYSTDTATDKVITTSSLPHLWSVANWDWSADNSTVTLNLICTRDNSHTHQIANIPATEVTVSEADCTHDKVIKYTASAEYDGYSFSTETENITVEGSALGHTYTLEGWNWTSDYSSASAKFVCAVENCPETVFVTDNEIDEIVITSPDCSNDKVVKYTASVEFTLTRNGSAQTFNNTTDTVTLTGTMTDHDWSEVTYTWNGYESVTAKRVCGNYDSHVEEETVVPTYSVTTAPAYSTQGEGTYTAVFTNADFETKTKTVEIASVKEQLVAALEESSITASDIDGIISDAEAVINGEADYDDDYSAALTGALEAFNTDKNDPEKIASLADAIESIKALVEEADDHLVYTLTVVYGNSNANDTVVRHAGETYALTEPSRAGYIFTGWTAGIPENLNGETGVYTFSAANDTITAGWSFDNAAAQSALDSAQAVLDNESEYETAYIAGLEGLVIALNTELNRPTPNSANVSNLISQINAKVAQANANKHSYTVFVTTDGVENPATCTQAGNALYRCANCSAAKVLAVSALGHDLGAWYTVTAPTPSENGLKRRECSRCDYFEEEEIVYTGEKARQIQFVVTSGMQYLVHLDEDRVIKSRTASAVYWYNDVDLSFEVVTGSSWSYEGYVVLVNGSVLQPNADGTFTLPGGVDYAQVNISPLIPDDDGSGSSVSGVCGYCGEVHANTLWGRIVAFFHAILNFFKNMFN